MAEAVRQVDYFYIEVPNKVGEGARVLQTLKEAGVNEKTIKEAGDKVTEADKAPIDRAIEKVKEALKGTDVAAIKSATAELEQASNAMAQHLYAKAAGAAGQPGGPEAGPTTPGSAEKKGGDDVIDAEYEVKK